MVDKLNELFINFCLKRKKSLTPTRLELIKTLSTYSKPVTAYQLQKDINSKGNNLNIATVYRVIEFWVNMGLVHKISSLNKFFMCFRPEEKHTHMINFCTDCEEVYESCNKSMGINIEKSSKDLGLKLLQNEPIEIPVLCPNCQ